MRTKLYKLLATTVIIGLFTLISIAQPPPPGEHGGDEDVQPAPIGSGLTIVLALGAAYGGKKT